MHRYKSSLISFFDTEKIYFFSFILFTIASGLKVLGFIYSINYIFLLDIICSIASGAVFLILSSKTELRYNKLFYIFVQFTLILAGILAILLGLNLIPLIRYTKNIEIIITIIIIILIINLVNYNLLNLVGGSYEDINVLYKAKQSRSSMLNPLFIVFVLIGEYFNIFFIEGLIVLSFGLTIIGECIKLSPSRYIEHILVSLNERPLSWEEVLMIDNRIAMLFGAPIFLFESHNVKHTWFNIVGINYLLKRHLVKQENGLYYLTDLGVPLADARAKGMLRMFRFLKHLTRPSLSPIFSLFFHLFLGSLKLFGFIITGSISLLGDGLDSAIDGISSILVSIAIRIKREIEVCYFLIFLMVISSIIIIYSSFNKIIHPEYLNEELLAFVIALISIMMCLSLYFYQRYSGYINQNLAILVQSEDSRNHVLNATLVLVAFIGNSIDLLIIDGLVGFFIGIMILRGAYELYQDLTCLKNGEDVDFEKYKLGITRGFDRFRLKMFDNWILFQIYRGYSTILQLTNQFQIAFRPIQIKHSNGDFYNINFPFKHEDLNIKLKKLSEENFIQVQEQIVKLTDKGTKRIESEIRSFRNHGN